MKTERPSYHNSEPMCLELAKVVANIVNYDYEEDDDLSEVCKILKRYAESDAYELAKELEDDLSVDMDFGIIEALDCMDVRGIKNRFIEEWVKAENITSFYKIGDTVTLPKSYKDGSGEITKIDTKQAIYYVHSPSQSATAAWIMKFEDVEPTK